MTEEIEKTEDGGVFLVSDRTKAHTLDVAAGCLSVELPCGYHYEGEMHTTAIVKEMTGYEEDILAGKGPITARINAILANCTIQLGTITDKGTIRAACGKITAQDRMVMLLAIRRVSLGDHYDVEVGCPNCNKVQKFDLNLSEIQIVPMKDRVVRDRETDLPSGQMVLWHVLNTQDESWLADKGKRKEDVLTLSLLSRVDKLDGVSLDREQDFKKAIQLLKMLSTKDRNYLRNVFAKEEGSVDTDVDFTCEDCRHEWKSAMDVGQSGFFFPSES